MNELLQNYSAIELAAMAYLALAIVKIILCLGNVNVATGVLHRKLGTHSRTFYFVVAVLLTTVVAFFRVPYALRTEGFRFFLVYADRKVIRDILSGI